MRFRGSATPGIMLCAFAVVTLLAATPVAAAEIAVANAGFENAGTNGLPEGWSLDSGAPPTSNRVTLDESVFHSGSTSLMVANVTPASVTLSSPPLRLQVGRLYRLSGWIRTDTAFADPTSRYPTAVAACLTMASFPFTNHSPTVGATTDWTRVETEFIATKGEDRLRVHLGLNGTATGVARFDDLAVEEVSDVSAYVPPETVRWFGPAYRYDDRGWIFLHVEGEPYQRGYQHGALLANEIVAYISKLGIQENRGDGAAGWATIRFQTDALLLRGYDEEYLTEMKGIADGAAHAGATYDGRAVDLLDIVALNSVVDLGQMHGATRVTPHALSGRSFTKAEDEMLLADDENKCSALAATGPATADGRVVFGQIFMWSGYTGVHWNVLMDLVPKRGHRLGYHTFPGGIHSGADFYVNSAGIVIGETTVSQTPFDITGTPQSNRIRKAAQYASSIDDVVTILRERNNGMYTNDWPIADVKTDEVAIFLLGTHKDKLWRSTDTPAPFGTPGFLWANNNNRDMEVRKEYLARADDSPFDLTFSPWNRDLAFNQFYREFNGKIDSIAAVDLWASSPINRAHACDGKITTSEMAEQLVYLAHYGKVTLREKFPEAGSRRMPDLPGAIPHLTTGYSMPSPIYLTEKLQAARASTPTAPDMPGEPTLALEEVSERYAVEKRRLWRGTVVPATTAEGWFVSGSATYWRMLDTVPEKADKAHAHVADELAALASRLLYTTAREEDIPPLAARQVYDRYGHYQIPRIKGTFALHQLRLLLGTETFITVMTGISERFAGKPATTAQIIAAAEELSGRSLDPFVRQWLERTGLPEPRPAATLSEAGDGWRLTLTITQPEPTYHLFTTIAIDVAGQRLVKPVEIEGHATTVEIDLPDRPTAAAFNPGSDFPATHERFYVWPNVVDDFSRLAIVYGTSRQIEANHTMALRLQTTMADAYTEVLPPLVKDSEITAAQLADNDLIVLGHSADNSLIARMAPELPLDLGKNFFRFREKTYGAPDDGLVLVLPSPYNPERTLYLILANSALQLYDMTGSYNRGLPSWALFKGAKVSQQGYHPVERFQLDL